VVKFSRKTSQPPKPQELPLLSFESFPDPIFPDIITQPRARSRRSIPMKRPPALSPGRSTGWELKKNLSFSSLG